MADKIERAFLEFHTKHPEVYKAIVEFAKEYQRSGIHVGIGHIWELCRYQLWLQGPKKGAYKMNNNHRSRYARLIMQQEPTLKGYFDTRRLRIGAPSGAWRTLR